MLKKLVVRKGEAPWDPGYKLLSTYQGQARILTPDGVEMRVNAERIKQDHSLLVEKAETAGISVPPLSKYELKRPDIGESGYPQLEKYVEANKN